uniref:Cytochrome P450 n=1 Tax=Panagrolaimus sp. JU765 TaxID=591449 RepID=A0AC34RSM3_9BILA
MFLLFIFFIFLFYNFYWKRKNYPPGPTPLPLIGNYWEIDKYSPGYEAYRKWQRKYGGIYTYWIAEIPVIAVCDYNLIQELFVKDGEAYAGRQPFGKLNEFMKGGHYGVVMTEGDFWKEQRRFTLNVMRNLGMSRTIMEEKILLEVSDFFKSIDENIPPNSKSTKINMIPIVNVAIANVINQLLFGFAHHDEKSKEEFKKWRELMQEHMRFGTDAGLTIALQCPEIFQYLPYFKDKLQLLKKQYRDVTKYYYLDFTEAYLKEIAKTNENYTRKQLVNILYEMFIAGQETTANTTIYSMICVLNYPETQKKLQQELKTIIGSDRFITLADKPKLIYCQAFINEVQRLVNILAQNLLHKTTKDVEIMGYKIKAGTTIVPQISCVLYDEKIFPDPYKFEPQRFINENGQLKKIDELIPFSIGKRQCLGESLAKMNLFIFIANFYNHYQLGLVENKVPSMDKINGIAVQPKQFECSITKLY